MSVALHLLDPAPTVAWAPYASSRPIAELLAGGSLIRQRWERMTASRAESIISAPHLSGYPDYHAAGAPTIRSDLAVVGPAVIGRSTFCPTDAIRHPTEPTAFVCDGEVVGWFVPANHEWTGPDSMPTAAHVPVDGLRLRGAFDLVTALETLLDEDIAAMLEDGATVDLPPSTTVLGSIDQISSASTDIEPDVLLDVRRGPIRIEHDVTLRAGTRLRGPVWIGRGTRIEGGDVRGCSIGPFCRIRGEMAVTAVHGYTNKAHDGFIGHSIIGSWVNLGANTVTSNLKNTYGAVRFEIDGIFVDTERTFLGSLIGDHAKTAIGTLLGTGTVIGCGANVFDVVRPPRFVPPFAWGGHATDRMQRDGFLRVAERVMPRRHVEVNDDVRGFLGRVYDVLTG